MGRRRDTYLSIDLDYWGDTRGACLRGMPSFLRRVVGLERPTRVVCNHNELLRHVNESGCRVLRNVDFHSDLGGFQTRWSARKGHYYVKRLPALNCGTWADHVEWAPDGSFVWHYPNREFCVDRGFGRCDGETSSEPFPPKSLWKNAEMVFGLRSLSLDRVRAVGIALSPDYIGRNMPKSAMKLLGRFVDDEELEFHLQVTFQKRHWLPPVAAMWLQSEACGRP